MPTTYSHYRFGKEVYKKLTPAQKAIIDPYRGLFDLGLHGPDLLFYYHPFSKNQINQTGVAIHERPGIAFFLPAASRWRSCRHKKAALAYLYGVLCHFALDSTCHPYVEAAVRRTGISHSEIEAEMDRRNMEKDSYNPLTHRPANHLRSKPGYAETIAVFYPKQSVHQIDVCIHSIRICCNLFVIPNLQMRSLILKLLKLVHFPKVIREMIIKCRKNPDCEPICRELDQLYAKYCRFQRMSGTRQKYEKFSHIILFSCTVFRIWQNPASLSACDYVSAGILLFLPYLDCFTI